MRGLRSSRLRIVAALAVAALVATACSSGDDDGGGDDTTDTGGADDTTGDDGGGDDASGGGSDAAFTYNTGIFEDTTTDNVWAYLDPESSVWNAYVLAETVASLYTIDYPDLVVAPELAANDWEPAVQDGDEWLVEVQIRDDANWSDGEPITSGDVKFTFETVRDLGLGGNWLQGFPVASDTNTGITRVETPDDKTVQIYFNNQPGLGVWPHGVGVTGAIMPEHFWADTVEEAKASDEPAAALYEASGAGQPSSGQVVFEEREAGAFARVSANDSYIRSGETVDFEAAGGGSYTVGPYFTEEVFSLYGGQDQAVLALQDGEVDFLYNSLGMQRGLRDQVVNNEDLTAISNPANGMRYLAFNMRRAPMSDVAFRKALATMIDREFMATNVLQGVAFPLYTTTPPGNAKWYNEDVAEQLKEPFVGYEDQESRLEAAVQILKDAGYTWESEPEVQVDEESGVKTVINGEGLINPDGTPVPELTLLAPGPGYDPLRSTYSVWIEQWAKQLGVPLTARPTNFNVIVDQVFPTTGEPQFDLYILGWSLGNPAFPTYYESFWHSRNITEVNQGNNTPGYSNPEYDDAADRFLASTTEEEAYDILWNELEPIFAEDLPYVVLFDTPILEFYRTAAVTYPYTESLGGIQYQNGMKEMVRAAN